MLENNSEDVRSTFTRTANCTNSGSQLPLYAEGRMVPYQYVAIPWSRSPLDGSSEVKYYVAQVLFVSDCDEHIFVIRYQEIYLNFRNDWQLSNRMDKEDRAILKSNNIVLTGREIVYKGLVTLEDNILLVNMTPVQIQIHTKLINECNIIRAWCPLGACVPLGAPVVIRQARLHGGVKSKGIFASEDIPSNLVVGEYRGKVEYLPPGHLFQKNTSCYVLDAAPVSTELNYFIIADKTHNSAWTRFINKPNSDEMPNVVFEIYKVSIEHPKIQDEFCILVLTTQDIKRGDQLLVEYKCTKIEI